MSSDDTPQKVGPYRIESLIGAGGMGKVFRAFDERLERRVALKQIRAERAEDLKARQRFLREAQLAARLNHPALVPIHDILDLGDTLWIVMEWVDGETLARRLKGGPLTLGEALPLAVDLLGGLAAIHAAGILHRDLKSENVLITAQGTVRIVDFGLAKTKESEASIASSGALLGTPRSMSPEQARCEVLGPPSDLFAFGVLLYEMLRGVPPFRGAGALEILAQVCHGSHEPLLDHVPGLSPEVSRLVDQLLAKSPVERPESADAVRRVLERIDRSHRPTETPPEPARNRRLDPAASTEAEIRRRAGERRQLTVLCCELIVVSNSESDSNASGSLDPEQLCEVLPSFQRLVHRAVDRFAAYLGDFQGHRAVLCFGYPQALEDAAQRAVLTAFEILAEWRSILDSFADGYGSDLEIRGGIHTGPAVVLDLDDGRRDRLVLGQTLHLAETIQKRAEPGTVLASEVTEQIIDGFFDVRPVEALAAGKDSSMALFRIDGARDLGAWREQTVEALPMVGRKHELEFLVGLHRLACEGVGQAVLVTAEAGAGKTCLLRALRDRLAKETPWISTRGRPYERDRILLPITALMQQAFNLDSNPDLEDPSQRLVHWIETLGLPVADFEPVLVELLEHCSARVRGEISDGEQQSIVAVVVEILLKVIEGFGDGVATILVFEDLQWMSLATLTVMERLVEQAVGTPVLLIVTSRPRCLQTRSIRGPTTALHLEALEFDLSQALTKALLDRYGREHRNADSIVARSGGVPGHIEALVRMKAKAPEDGGVPAGLLESLGAELDRLGSAKAVVHLASVLGETFSLGELEALGPFDALTLEYELERLVDAKVFEQHAATDRLWGFRSNLMREVARESWLVEDLEVYLAKAESLGL